MHSHVKVTFMHMKKVSKVALRYVSIHESAAAHGMPEKHKMVSGEANDRLQPSEST